MFKFRNHDRYLPLGPRAILWLALGLLCVAPVPAPAQSGDNRRMQRDIRMMENVLDHVMVESRNVLVGSKHSVNGVYIQGIGAVFTVEARLLLRDRRFGNAWFWSGHDDHDGWHWRRHRDRDDDLDDDDDSRDDRRKRRARDEEELYNDAKAELSEALVDYGDTLGELAPSDWVAVCMILDESARIGDRKITRLVLKARASDLRDAASKKLSRDAAMKKLIIEEY